MNPTHFEGGDQSCTWEPAVNSRSFASLVLSDDDQTVRISIRESRSDGIYTQSASVTLTREDAIDMIKCLSGLI